MTVRCSNNSALISFGGERFGQDACGVVSSVS